MKTKSLLIILFLIFFNQNSFGWGTTGHRIIAEIAQKNLSKKSEKKVLKMLDNYPMAYWANWADQVRSDSLQQWKHTYVWHYVNVPSGLSKQDFIDSLRLMQQDNIYKAIIKSEKSLSNKDLSMEQRTEALYFLIHLIGDIHQPMHVARAEDLGGNKLKVSWFNSNDNLHNVWDSRLVDFQQYSYTEYAETLNNALSKDERKSLSDGTLEDWAYETYQLTNEIYNLIKPNEKLSYAYSYHFKRKMEIQFIKAGLRLARILESF